MKYTKQQEEKAEAREKRQEAEGQPMLIKIVEMEDLELALQKLEDSFPDIFAYIQSGTIKLKIKNHKAEIGKNSMMILKERLPTLRDKDV